MNLPGQLTHSNQLPNRAEVAVLSGGLPVLFVGSREIADALAAEIAALQAEEILHTPGEAAIALATLTSQKAALERIRTDPPKVMLVEVDRHPNSRQRFCETIHYRVPNMLICAVRRPHPEGASIFDAVLDFPLVRDQLQEVLAGAAGQAGSHILQRGPIRLNLATRTVYSLNGQHHMTPKQCALLHMLMENHDTVVSRSAIMAAVWETTYMADTRTLDVHVRWLRERIEVDPSEPVYLLTERGKGYRLRTP